MRSARNSLGKSSAGMRGFELTTAINNGKMRNRQCTKAEIPIQMRLLQATYIRGNSMGKQRRRTKEYESMKVIDSR
jgi:hypothetical protein